MLRGSNNHKRGAHLPVSPEVVGDVAALIDPMSSDEMTDAMLLLTKNQTYRQCLIAKGAKRTQMFSWEKTVAKTVEVYQSLHS